MMSFSKDIDSGKSISARISSYSISLLDAGKSSHMTYSIFSLVGALNCNPTPAPVWREAPSTLRIHQPVLSRSTSGWGSSTKKSTSI